MNIGKAYMQGFRIGGVDDNKSTSEPNPANMLGLHGTGNLFHHMMKLIVCTGDPRVKPLVAEYNAWYASEKGEKPPKWVESIEKAISNRLHARPIAYGNNTEIAAFSTKLMDWINENWAGKPKLMRIDHDEVEIDKSSVYPYRNLDLVNKYVKGFILWDMVTEILPKKTNKSTQQEKPISEDQFDSLFKDVFEEETHVPLNNPLLDLCVKLVGDLAGGMSYYGTKTALTIREQSINGAKRAFDEFNKE